MELAGGWQLERTVTDSGREGSVCGTLTISPDVAGDRMRTVWRVTGPAKDQLLVTSLRRIGTATG